LLPAAAARSTPARLPAPSQAAAKGTPGVAATVYNAAASFLGGLKRRLSTA
jgi:hypothetical protein